MSTTANFYTPVPQNDVNLKTELYQLASSVTDLGTALVKTAFSTAKVTYTVTTKYVIPTTIAIASASKTVAVASYKYVVKPRKLLPGYEEFEFEESILDNFVDIDYAPYELEDVSPTKVDLNALNEALNERS
jgi:hypothetical protein